MIIEAETLIDELIYPESPRWHNERVWFTDIPAHRVMSWDEEAGVTVELDTAAQSGAARLGPSGLAFLPDGTGIIAMMCESGPLAGKVLAFENGQFETYCDVTSLGGGRLNDMVASGEGHVYVGGLDGALIIHLDIARRASVALSGVPSPNGMAISQDGKDLFFVSRGSTVSVAPRGRRGSLGAPRLWADFSLEAVVRRHVLAGDHRGPIRWEDLDALSGADGIALDAEGGVWVGGTSLEKFMRVDEHGSVTHVIRTPGRHAIACCLGGADRRTLFMTTAALAPGTMRTGGVGSPGLIEQLTASRTRGRLERARVPISGHGWP